MQQPRVPILIAKTVHVGWVIANLVAQLFFVPRNEFSKQIDFFNRHILTFFEIPEWISMIRIRCLLNYESLHFTKSHRLIKPDEMFKNRFGFLFVRRFSSVGYSDFLESKVIRINEFRTLLSLFLHCSLLVVQNWKTVGAKHHVVQGATDWIWLSLSERKGRSVQWIAMILRIFVNFFQPVLIFAAKVREYLIEVLCIEFFNGDEVVCDIGKLLIWVKQVLDCQLV